MTDSVDLTPTRYAALVAPAVSRAFVAGIRAAGPEGRELVASYGGPAAGNLIELRNPLAAGRPVTPEGLAAVHRYADPAEREARVQRSLDHGLLARDLDGALTATARGLAFLRDLFALHAQVLGARWGEGADRSPVSRVLDPVARVLAEAEATAGEAWAVQAPPHEPPGTPPAALLLNRLGTLRYHRADAYAAAWRAAGLTAAEVAAQPWGTPWTAQREAAERGTNERAGVPYAVLTAEERLQLLADLATLP